MLRQASLHNVVLAPQAAVPQQSVNRPLELDSAKMSGLEIRLNEVDSKLSATVSHVEKQLAEVYELLADRSKSAKDSLDISELVSAASCGGHNIRGEISDLRRQFASLQSAVDGDVLDAFRRLRQQTTDTATKLEGIMAGHVPQASAGAPVSSVSSPSIADLEALESRLSTCLVERTKELRLAMPPPVDVQALEERLSTVLLARVEEIGRELRDLSASVDLQGLESRLSHSLQKRAEDIRSEMSAQSAGVLQAYLLKQERETAKVSNCAEMKAVTEMKVNASEDLMRLSELEASARASCAEAMAWSECAQQGVEKVAAAMRGGEQKSDWLSVLDKRMSEVGQDLLLLMEERFAAVEMQIHSESKENARNCSVVREELIEMTGLLYKTLEDRIASLSLLKGSEESCLTISPGQKTASSGSPASKSKQKSPREKDAAELAAMAAGDFAREALGALRERIDAPSATTKAEDAVIAAIAAARAAASPESNRSVVSTFSPLAGLDPVVGYPKFGSCMSPPQCNDWTEACSSPLTTMPESEYDGIQGKQDSNKAHERNSPQRPHRGRQLPGRPEPRDFPEISVQDSPWRRKQHSRDLLPQFGSSSHSLSPWSHPEALQSLQEETTTECGSTAPVSRDNSASAPSSAKAGASSEKGAGTRRRPPPRTQSPSSPHRQGNPVPILMEKKRVNTPSAGSPPRRNEKTKGARNEKRSVSPAGKTDMHK